MSKDIFMKRKTATKILSFLIVSSFFLPLFEWHGFEMSGLNYILSEHIPAYKYVLLLIPFSAIFLFWGSTEGGKYLFNKEILSFMPLASLVFISIARLTDNGSKNSFYDNENLFFSIDPGFWLLLFFSLLLVLVKDEKKKVYSTF